MNIHKYLYQVKNDEQEREIFLCQVKVCEDKQGWATETLFVVFAEDVN